MFSGSWISALFVKECYHPIFAQAVCSSDLFRLDHVWSYGVREVVSSIPDRCNILQAICAFPLWGSHPRKKTVIPAIIIIICIIIIIIISSS